MFQRRRTELLRRLGGGVLLLSATPVARRNGDADHAYRQSSDLLYLTGFLEPETVLVLNRTRPTDHVGHGRGGVSYRKPDGDTSGMG